MKQIFKKWKATSTMFKMFASFLAIAILALLVVASWQEIAIGEVSTILMVAIFWILVPTGVAIVAIRYILPIHIVDKLPPADSPFWDEMNAQMGGRPRL